MKYAVVKSGGSSRITIPADWVEKQGVQKGAELRQFSAGKGCLYMKDVLMTDEELDRMFDELRAKVKADNMGMRR